MYAIIVTLRCCTVAHTANLIMALFTINTDTHGGLVVALRGYDGTELWRATTRSITLDLSCADVDVSGDGRLDCIIAGCNSTLQAIDVLTGMLPVVDLNICLLQHYCTWKTRTQHNLFVNLKLKLLRLYVECTREMSLKILD